MKTKKLLTIILSLVAVASLSACDKGTEKSREQQLRECEQRAWDMYDRQQLVDKRDLDFELDRCEDQHGYGYRY